MLSPTRRAPKRAAKEFRSLRRAVGLSLQDVALETGISTTYLSRFESGILELRSDQLRLLNQLLKHTMQERVRRFGRILAESGPGPIIASGSTTGAPVPANPN